MKLSKQQRLTLILVGIVGFLMGLTNAIADKNMDHDIVSLLGAGSGFASAWLIIIWIIIIIYNWRKNVKQKKSDMPGMQ